MMSVGNASTSHCIVDCRMSFHEAIAGTTAPEEVLQQLCLLEVSYYSFDGALHRGQLVVHRQLAGELEEMFAMMREIRFPVARVIPIVRYGWSDLTSMADNNTSCFNYRFIAGSTRLSHHATGKAIDINPCQNPVIYEDGTTLPPEAVYMPQSEGVLGPASPLLQEFLSRHWQWGGKFASLKDYHHLEKPG